MASDAKYGGFDFAVTCATVDQGAWSPRTWARSPITIKLAHSDSATEVMTSAAFPYSARTSATLQQLSASSGINFCEDVELTRSLHIMAMRSSRSHWTPVYIEGPLRIRTTELSKGSTLTTNALKQPFYRTAGAEQTGPRYGQRNGGQDDAPLAYHREAATARADYTASAHRAH